MMAPLHAGSPNRSSCRTFVLVICRIGDFPQNGVQCVCQFSLENDDETSHVEKVFPPF